MTIILLAPLAQAQVSIQGVSEDMAAAIRAGMSLPETCDQSEWLVRYRFRSSKQEIATSLQTYGYYSPVISADLHFDSKCWHADFKIDPGPPAIIANDHIEIQGEGAGMPAFTRILAASSIKQGARFDQDGWEALKTAIENAATRFGFRQGHFKAHEARVDADHNRVDVDLVYDTGPRYRFGKTTFDSSKLDEDLLRRYIPWKEGEPFDGQKLGVLYQSLLDSGYFSDALIDSSHVSGTAIDIHVGLTLARRARSRIGLGYSTDLGPSLSVGRKVERINKRGHQLNTQFSMSPVETTFTGEYRIPRVEDKAAWISIYGGYLGQHTSTSKTSKSTLGVRRVIPLRNLWIETPYVEITNDRSYVSGLQTSNLAIVPGISFSRTHSDSLSGRPRRAESVALALSGTSRALGSTLDYFRVTANAKLIRSVTDRIRFIGRGEVGAVLTSDFTRVPADVRFFTGGDNSVRGYGFNEIGARDANGNLVGGDRLIVGSAELDFAVKSHWAIATFVDTGSVSISSIPAKFERSVGIGLRWYSPIGPIRVDFARPIAAGRGIKLHISLGPDL